MKIATLREQSEIISFGLQYQDIGKSCNFAEDMKAMVFRDIELKDRATIENALSRSGIANCDLTFANLFCWKNSYRAQIATIGDAIVIRYCYNERDFTFSVYVPQNHQDLYPELFQMVEDYAREHKEKVRYYALGKDAIEFIRKNRPEYGFHFDRERSEYIYKSEDLAGLHGGHLKAKRNHLNKFRSTYDFSYQSLSALDSEECLELLETWNKEHISQGLFAKEEVEKEKESIKTAFKHFDELGLLGGAIRISGHIVAFCFGSELSPDTFCVHIEKADTQYEGIFAAISQQFAEHLPQRYIYINREEDLGFHGLRYSKESYHPYRMENKYLAEPMDTGMVEIRRLWMECFKKDSMEDAEQFLFTKFDPQNMVSISDGDHIISMIHLVPFSNRAYCFAVATDPQYRHRGLATELFKKSIDICKEKGFEEIVVIPDDEDLARWYHSLGCYGDFKIRFNESEIADPLCPDGCCLGTGDISKDRAVVFPLTSFRHKEGDEIHLY